MLNKARSIRRQLSEWRRDFHMHPELGFQETRTAQKVAEILEGLGYRVRRHVGGTGVVADLGSGSPRIAIRADMDALPIQEINAVAYASQTAGVMHACGHDAHIAMALGAAWLLAREKFPGSVRFLFQPSEEINGPDGLSGAPRMIRDGALQDVDMVIAQHVEPAAPAGVVRIEPGAVSGGVDDWTAAIIGRGGHGAHPYEGIDPFQIAAHVLLALYAINSRRLSPFQPAVVSVGAVHGGDAANVIPDRVTLRGTLRYRDPDLRPTLHAEIRRALELSAGLGGRFELEFETGIPPMVNHPLAAELIRAAACGLLGAERVLPMEKELGAEDFGCFTEVVPGAMFNLGTRIEGDERYGHNPRFDIDEEALPVGAAVLAESALRFLNGK